MMSMFMNWRSASNCTVCRVCSTEQREGYFPGDCGIVLCLVWTLQTKELRKAENSGLIVQATVACLLEKTFGVKNSRKWCHVCKHFADFLGIPDGNDWFNPGKRKRGCSWPSLAPTIFHRKCVLCCSDHCACVFVWCLKLWFPHVIYLIYLSSLCFNWTHERMFRVFFACCHHPWYTKDHFSMLMWTYIAAVFRPVENPRTVFGHDQSWIHDGLEWNLASFETVIGLNLAIDLSSVFFLKQKIAVHRQFSGGKAT